MTVAHNQMAPPEAPAQILAKLIGLLLRILCDTATPAIATRCLERRRGTRAREPPPQTVPLAPPHPQTCIFSAHFPRMIEKD